MNRYNRISGVPDIRSRMYNNGSGYVPVQNNISVMPMTSCTDNCPKDMQLAMAYVRTQPFRNMYDVNDGWHRGTIFAELDLPYEGGCGKRGNGQ